ncbi:MAG TPA: hypothetical protein VNT79_12220 [Phycisphaerae bacterium]|nr:hypothetical protein [Phycisphaerae bacterium]
MTRSARIAFLCGILPLVHALTLRAGEPVIPLPTNLQNFYLRGTQPGDLEPFNEIIPADEQCSGCHSGDAPIYDEWRGNLMAQSARDPVFYACLDIAEKDAPGSGDVCIRCHVPKAWLEGRSTPTNGMNIQRRDRDGVTCHVCHRMVDPFDPNFSATPIDELILLGLGEDRPIQSMDLGNPAMPGFGGNSSYVIDPFDRRRGPFPVGPDFNPLPPEVACDDFHEAVTLGLCEDDAGGPAPCPTFESPLHRSSQLCAACHDVSFPHVSYNAQGEAVLNGPGQRNPDGNKYNMAAEQRTFSEWLKSSFAQGGVDMGGRFGAPGQNVVSSCQDCHMPRHEAQGCHFIPEERPDIPEHAFYGAATWVLDAVGRHYGPGGPFPGFPPADEGGPDFFEDTLIALEQGKLRNEEFLTKSADLEVSLEGSGNPGEMQLRVRVINQTGHKLPTGYFEGRRIFLTVEYFGCDAEAPPMVVFGGYDSNTAILDAASTKVYHAEAGPDENVAAAAGVPAAPSSHTILGVKKYFDNRIPPRGFTNAGYAAIQAEPVAYSYSDGQYWDDTLYVIPEGAAGARITLYYQQTTKEYIEFLRDRNPFATTNPTNRGALAYALWNATGRSAPVLMAQVGGGGEPFDVSIPGGANCDPLLSFSDIEGFVAALLGLTDDPAVLEAADLDGLDGPDGKDIQLFVESLLGQSP